jgi:hypothetical protein
MTWLQELGKFLPDSWCDESLIFDKVAKDDADPVPEHLWDNRVQLVIPSVCELKGFQTLALLWQWKYMYRQFRKWMSLCHGSDWNDRLEAIRRLTACAAHQAVATPPRKRSQGGSPHSTPAAKPTFGPKEELCPLLSQLDLAIHLDADAGCQVLTRCFGGK